jgi:hypothetical protein
LNFSNLPHRRVKRTAKIANGSDALDAIARLKEAVAKTRNLTTTGRLFSPPSCAPMRQTAIQDPAADAIFELETVDGAFCSAQHSSKDPEVANSGGNPWHRP